MADPAVLGVTISIVLGLSLFVYDFWKRRDWSRSLLIFFLPLLAYLLWHFSVEAYDWGSVWKEALAKSNSEDVTLQVSIAVALVDLKVLFTVFLIFVWIYLWRSMNHGKKG